MTFILTYGDYGALFHNSGTWYRHLSCYETYEVKFHCSHRISQMVDAVITTQKSQQKMQPPKRGTPGQTPHEVYAAMISYTYVWYGHLGQWRHQKKCAKIRYKPRILQWANSPVRPAVCANEVKFWCECKGLPFSGFRSLWCTARIKSEMLILFYFVFIKMIPFYFQLIT